MNAARRPRGADRHYSSTFVDHGNRPERESGDDDYPVAPIPPHERMWRHPSELGGGQMMVVEPQPAFGKGLAAGAAVLSLLLVAGLTRIMVPGDSDTDIASSVTAAVQRASTPLLGTATTPTSAPGDTATTDDTSLSPGTSSFISTIGSDPATVDTTISGSGVPATDPTDTTAAPATDAPSPIDLPTTPPSTGSTIAPPPVALVMSSQRQALAVEVQQGTVFVTTSAAVGDSRSTSVVLESGQTVEADVVMVDEEAGIAVLVVSSPEPQDPDAPDASMPPAIADEPEPGDLVTVMRGTDSDNRSAARLGDAIADNGGRELLYADLGDEIGEGAPVIDADGNLVGLCTESGTRTWVVPASALARAVDASLEMTRGSAWLGITGERVESGGVSVLEIDEGSPAALSGLIVGDVVVAVEGRPVLSLAELAIDLGEHTPGDLVTITVDRDGTLIDVAVVLGARPPGA
jgi:S1-C subfamily serine protease